MKFGKLEKIAATLGLAAATVGSAQGKEVKSTDVDKVKPTETHRAVGNVGKAIDPSAPVELRTPAGTPKSVELPGEVKPKTPDGTVASALERKTGGN